MTESRLRGGDQLGGWSESSAELADLLILSGLRSGVMDPAQVENRVEFVLL